MNLRFSYDISFFFYSAHIRRMLWQGILLSVNNHQRRRETKKNISNTKDGGEARYRWVTSRHLLMKRIVCLTYISPRIYKLTCPVTHTHTQSRAGVRIRGAVVRGRGDMVTSGQPTHEPSTYICVLKGIQEYILHMLYCRLIFNSAAMALEGNAVGAYGHTLSPREAAWINAPKASRILPRKHESSLRAHYY